MLNGKKPDPNYDPQPYEEETKDTSLSYSKLLKINFVDKAIPGNLIKFDSNAIGLCKNASFEVQKNLGEGGQGFTLLCVKKGGD